MEEIKPGWQIDSSLLSYFAGFFDGEGSIGIRENSKSCKYVLGVQISNTCLSPLILFKKYFNGKILGPYQRKGNCKPYYRWTTEAKKAEFFLKNIQPYLLVKIEQCRLAMLLRNNWTPLSRGTYQNRNPSKDISELNRRREIWKELKKANHRGRILA